MVVAILIIAGTVLTVGFLGFALLRAAAKGERLRELAEEAHAELVKEERLRRLILLSCSCSACGFWKSLGFERERT